MGLFGYAIAVERRRIIQCQVVVSKNSSHSDVQDLNDRIDVDVPQNNAHQHHRDHQSENEFSLSTSIWSTLVGNDHKD